MQPRKLDLVPVPIDEDDDVGSLVQDAFTMLEPHIAVFHVLPDTVEPVRAFLARSPDDAIRWIYRRVSKKQLLKYIQQVYDNPQADTERASADLTDEDCERPSKRVRKETTTKQVNKRLKDQLDYALVETVANSQDIVTAKTNEIAYSDHELKYRNVAKTFERIGISEVAEIINRAKAVATVDCLQEWKAVLGT